MILGMCADCKCCPAEVKAGDDAICWKCDEGKPCKVLERANVPFYAAVQAAQVALPPVRVEVLPASKPVAEAKEEEPVTKNVRVSVQGKRISDEVRATILSYGPEVSHSAIARKVGVSEPSVHNIRKAAGVVRVSPVATKKFRAKQRPPRQHPEMVVAATLAGELDTPAAVLIASALHESKSGATSSHVSLRHDLIPREFKDILARRYTMGAEVHGVYGYRKGFRDRAFITDRIGHIHEHLNKLFQPLTGDDDSFVDNLGAIGWGIGFLAEVWADPQGRVILESMIRAQPHE